MKIKTDERLKTAAAGSKEQVIDEIKKTDPTRFDQMLIESEERKTYFYVNHESLAYKRTPYVLKFPLYKELSKDFEENFLSNGKGNEPVKVESSELIQKLIQKGKSPEIINSLASKNLAFHELKLDLNGDVPSLKQPFYFIPSETDSCSCGNCDGEKYVTCPDSDCNGQHIYDCDDCGAMGEVDCHDCDGHGEFDCTECNGGWKSCSKCKGAGEVVCPECTNYMRPDDHQNVRRCSTCGHRGKGNGTVPCKKCAKRGEVRCSNCNNGIVKCSTCKSRGRITCSNCNGKRQITCSTCYGDHKDNRYGKVDCEVCETMGVVGQISFIETEIEKQNFEFTFTGGKEINAPGFDISSIKKHAKSNEPLTRVYHNLNGAQEDSYDEFSKKCSEKGLIKAGFSKEKYPKLISEKLYYEGVPCATYNYNHILSATFHDVSVLAIDKDKEVLFHSDPTSVKEEKESFLEKVKELISSAFSTKAYNDKIDRKHEMFLLIHMSKADGIIEDREKRYLAQSITGLQGFTIKEKAELFGLMSSKELPPVSPLNAYFSSKDRAEEATRKLKELAEKGDGEYEKSEKAKMEEINTAVEAGFKAKPSGIGQFFKTWQISIPLILVIISLPIGIYWAAYILPVSIAEYKHEKLLVTAAALDKYIEAGGDVDAAEALMSGDIYLKYTAELNVNELSHSSDLTFDTNGSEITYSAFWNSQKEKYKTLLQGIDEEVDNKTENGSDDNREEPIDQKNEEDDNKPENESDDNREEPIDQKNNEANAESQVVSTFYMIQDDDGFSNLRSEPKGEVIQKVYETERFEVIGKEDGYSKVKLENGTVGFIHTSRVIEAKDVNK
jgi:hypothetical protein